MYGKGVKRRSAGETNIQYRHPQDAKDEAYLKGPSTNMGSSLDYCPSEGPFYKHPKKGPYLENCPNVVGS